MHEHLKNKCEFQILDVKKVGYINFPKLRSISFFYNLAKINIVSDIIHIHNPKFSGIAKNHKNTILTIHGDFVTELYKEYGTFGNIVTNYIENKIKYCKLITTVNPYWAKIRDWIYIPNGIDLVKIKKIEPSQERFILFVGRKDKIKGYDLFEQICKNFSYPSKMLFDRPWEEVISFMKSAYCIVMPSKVEGFPTVILEAWACGCPVVASNIPELKVISETAIYFAERNVKDLTEAVHKIIDDAQGTSIAKHGIVEVEKYDWKNVSNMYYDLYLNLYNKR